MRDGLRRFAFSLCCTCVATGLPLLEVHKSYKRMIEFSAYPKTLW
jgi:hypothetical protein